MYKQTGKTLAFAYVCTGFFALEVAESPKLHWYFNLLPTDVFAKATVLVNALMLYKKLALQDAGLDPMLIESQKYDEHVDLVRVTFIQTL